MADTIAAGGLPAPILALYVFGSYSRGALDPQDLDLILVYGEPDVEVFAQCERRAKETARTFTDELCGGQRRFESLLAKALRKPGEKIDLITMRSLDSALSQFKKISREDVRLVWSPQQPEAARNLAAILPDPNAGTAPRHQFISPKRARCGLQEVEEITLMLDREELTLIRISLNSIEIKLSPENQHLLECWTQCRMMGRQALRTLPFAMWWMQSERAGRLCPPDLMELWNHQRTRRAQIGNLKLWQIPVSFMRSRKLRHQCLIPHVKQKEANELLVFERGPKWSKRCKPN